MGFYRIANQFCRCNLCEIVLLHIFLRLHFYVKFINQDSLHLNIKKIIYPKYLLSFKFVYLLIKIYHRYVDLLNINLSYFNKTVYTYKSAIMYQKINLFIYVINCAS